MKRRFACQPFRTVHRPDRHACGHPFLSAPSDVLSNIAGCLLVSIHFDEPEKTFPPLASLLHAAAASRSMFAGMRVDRTELSVSMLEEGCDVSVHAHLEVIFGRVKLANVHELSIGVYQGEDAELIRLILAHCKQVRRLTFHGFSRLLVGAIHHCPQLKIFHTSSLMSDSLALHLVSHCKSLAEVEWGGGIMEEGDAWSDYDTFSDRALCVLAPYCKVVRLHGSKITDNGVKLFVAKAKRLLHLEVRCCESLSPIGMHALSRHCVGLQSIVVQFMDDNDAMCVFFMNLDSNIDLQKAVLGHGEADTSLQILCHRFGSTLQDLTVDFSTLSRQTCELLASRCTRLRKLSVTYTEIFAHGGTQVLTKCLQRLSELEIQERKIRDSDIQLFAEHCKFLERVSIAGARRITVGAILDLLRNLPLIREIRISLCDKIGDPEVRDIEEIALPRRISTDIHASL